jgi:hypothetical protein
LVGPISANGEDRIDKLGIFVAVVELAHPHVASAMDFAVIGRAIVHPDVLDLHAAEIELAGRPRVLIAATGAAGPSRR